MPEMTNATAIRLNAGHDTNGNPRRVYVVLRDGQLFDAIDEGYHGSSALADKYPQFADKPVYTFATTPKEYRQLVKDGGRD